MKQGRDGSFRYGLLVSSLRPEEVENAAQASGDRKNDMVKEAFPAHGFGILRQICESTKNRR